MRNIALVVLGILIGLVAARTAAQTATAPGGYVIEQDAAVAASETASTETPAYSFFKTVPALHLVFRKRALKPGAAIGYHRQTEDEIYYVLTGRGRMTLDGKVVDVGPGTAILTRTGSSHGLTQVGADDLVILINYEQAPRSSPR